MSQGCCASVQLVVGKDGDQVGVGKPPAPQPWDANTPLRLFFRSDFVLVNSSLISSSPLLIPSVAGRKRESSMLAAPRFPKGLQVPEVNME